MKLSMDERAALNAEEAKRTAEADARWHAALQKGEEDLKALHASHEWKAAGRVIKHLWGIFVLLPVVLGILFAIVK
jgi:hypothetical protein